VTAQPEPTPTGSRTAGEVVRPLRDIAALVLVAAPAVLLFVAVIRLFPSAEAPFASRAQDSFAGFVNVATIGFPLLGVLLATLVRPMHPRAKLITVAAVVEYAVAAVFAIIFGILVGLANAATYSFRVAFEEFLVRLAWLAVFGIAAFAVFQIWRNLYYQPRPKRPPGTYGQPQHGGPPFEEPSHGRLPYPPPYGQQEYGQPQQQEYGQPQQYGQHSQPPSGPPPAAHPAWGQPPASAPPAPHPGHSGQPGPSGPPAAGFDPRQPGPDPYGPYGAPPGPGSYGAAPGYQPGQYGGAAPGGYPEPGYPEPAAYPEPSAYPEPGPYAEPTQAVPRHQPADDRTARVNDDDFPYGRPGGQEPPRR
jgi:hypothetical protein